MMTPDAVEEVHRRRRWRRRTRRASRLASRRACQKLLLPPDRLGADRRELGVLADRFEQRIAVHRLVDEVVVLDGLPQQPQRRRRGNRRARGGPRCSTCSPGRGRSWPSPRRRRPGGRAPARAPASRTAYPPTGTVRVHADGRQRLVALALAQQDVGLDVLRPGRPRVETGEVPCPRVVAAQHEQEAAGPEDPVLRVERAGRLALPGGLVESPA